ncbi:hypothetical protein DFA_05899 [Cavenderia fasciculata]|uniref:Uncharacterized protein n=1 Tax=Cavenderia fasciculata TaxID=261658 RepID=F4PJJ0_CACFS|nr:uncharacterized protein DFA_05899 [Cavenderia fasciculata]EGG23764.1 hypothetical protein DFA_05899 [Cavenderia fasciculata]|eukprot:XP_004361615.1 hypothetical protein DFA_05899 [Cavenderia fasciculata]
MLATTSIVHLSADQHLNHRPDRLIIGVKRE